MWYVINMWYSKKEKAVNMWYNPQNTNIVFMQTENWLVLLNCAQVHEKKKI